MTIATAFALVWYWTPFAALIGGVLGGLGMTVLYVWLSGRKGINFETLHRPIPIFMAAGLVLLPLLGNNLTSPPMILVATAWFYIQILLWVTLAAPAARRKPSRVPAFANGLLARRIVIHAIERDVLPHLARRLNADAIAKALMLWGETVRAHFKHIYQKTGINSQQELLGMIGDVEII